jgi:hypothetical protein
MCAEKQMKKKKKNENLFKLTFFKALQAMAWHWITAQYKICRQMHHTRKAVTKHTT